MSDDRYPKGKLMTTIENEMTMIMMVIFANDDGMQYHRFIQTTVY